MAVESLAEGRFAPMSSGRLLVIGGIALIAVGMIFGEVFAVFVLHPNAARIGGALQAATRAVAAEDPSAALGSFARIGGLLENRGTKVDTHVHMIDFGYLALFLGLLQPYVGLSPRLKKQLAALFLWGAVLLPVSVFLIHYVGLAHSPLGSIGWASILADFGGLLVLVACAGQLGGVWKYLAGRHPRRSEELPNERSWASRMLLGGGTLLVLAGFLHGAYYSAVDLYRQEQRDQALLRRMMDQAAEQNLPAALGAVDDYGSLQAEKAVKIAAHAHLIEFGLLAMLLAFIQPYVFLRERWKRFWVITLFLGSIVLPVFVLLELRWGLVAGGIADLGGLLVIVALVGMLAGVVRYTGKLDAEIASSP